MSNFEKEMKIPYYRSKTFQSGEVKYVGGFRKINLKSSYASFWVKFFLRKYHSVIVKKRKVKWEGIIPRFFSIEQVVWKKNWSISSPSDEEFILSFGIIEIINARISELRWIRISDEVIGTIFLPFIQELDNLEKSFKLKK